LQIFPCSLLAGFAMPQMLWLRFATETNFEALEDVHIRRISTDLSEKQTFLGILPFFQIPFWSSLNSLIYGTKQL
jgi:hypothetical protein